MITKKALVGAISSKIKKPIAALPEDNWGWKQSLCLNSEQMPELKDSKIGSKIRFEGEGVVKSINANGDVTLEINKIG